MKTKLVCVYDLHASILFSNLIFDMKYHVIKDNEQKSQSILAKTWIND